MRHHSHKTYKTIVTQKKKQQENFLGFTLWNYEIPRTVNK